MANRYLISGFVAAFPIRFLLHSESRGSLRPYLSLPLSPSRLVSADLALTPVSAHTLAALAVLGPLWLRVVAPALSPVAAAGWAVAAIALVGVWTYGTVLAHDVLGRRSRGLWISVAALMTVGIADVWIGLQVLPAASATLLARPWLAAGTFAAATALILRFVHRARLDALRTVPHSDRFGQFEWLEMLFRRMTRRGDAWRYAALEFRMLFRHRRTRGILLLIVLTGPYFGLLAALSGEQNIMMYLLYGFGGVPAFYSQFLFSGQHGHLDRLFTHPDSLEAMAMGKILFLQIGILASTVLNSPFLFFLPLPVVLLAGATILFLLGAFAPFAPLAAAGTSTPIDLSKSVFTFGGGGSFHLFGLIIPLLYLFGVAFTVTVTQNALWTLLLVAPGLAGLAAQPWFARQTAHRLRTSRHTLLHALRTNDPQ
jgi:hypothetical protein